ncbi:MAG: hypothetical protein Q8M03_05625, partial [Legionella sp.]|nr:hypothetical protein [Legionella sp.]
MIPLTAEYISQKLREAQADSITSQEYAEMAVKPQTRLNCAAVLVPLTHYKDEWHMLFTRRTDRVESH